MSASETMALMISSLFLHEPIRATNDLSILMPWTGKLLSLDSDEYPVPKSSMEMLLPRFYSSRRWRMASASLA